MTIKRVVASLQKRGYVVWFGATWRTLAPCIRSHIRLRVQIWRV
eukprot:SAG11_NODE_1128_length_5762_cov_2.633763_2_plen_44_part_00